MFEDVKIVTKGIIPKFTSKLYSCQEKSIINHKAIIENYMFRKNIVFDLQMLEWYSFN